MFCSGWHSPVSLRSRLIAGAAQRLRAPPSQVQYKRPSPSPPPPPYSAGVSSHGVLQLGHPQRCSGRRGLQNRRAGSQQTSSHALPPQATPASQDCRPALFHRAADGQVNYAAVLDTAADVARALLHLHRQQVGPAGRGRAGGFMSHLALDRKKGQAGGGANIWEGGGASLMPSGCPLSDACPPSLRLPPPSFLLSL